MKDWKFLIRVIYNDHSEFSFSVTISGTKSGVMANMMMITRGTLMASNAKKIYCYDSEGDLEIAYYK